MWFFQNLLWFIWIYYDLFEFYLNLLDFILLDFILFYWILLDFIGFYFIFSGIFEHLKLIDYVSWLYNIIPIWLVDPPI